MNKVILVGRITKDPELRTLSSGSSVVNFTIAVNRPIAQQQDQNASNADFISCVIWNKQAENLAKYVKQGSLIGVEGRIQTRNYESNGTTRYVTEVLCDNVQFLEKKNQPIENEDMDYPYSDEDSGDVSNDVDEPEQSGDNKNLEGFDVTDDDLPF